MRSSAATEEALAPAEAAAIFANAAETARQHSPAAERDAFPRVLADLDTLWESA